MERVNSTNSGIGDLDMEQGPMEVDEDIFLKRWGKGVNKPIVDKIREKRTEYYNVINNASTYTINFTHKGRVFSLLFEYLDYVHDSKLRKGLDESIKAFLPWVHKDHETNFIEFLIAHNEGYVGILQNMIEGAEPIDIYFQLVYNFYINLGVSYNIGAKGLKNIGKIIKEYNLDKSTLQGTNQEKAFKYLLLQILKKKGHLKIIPIIDYLDTSKFIDAFKDVIYCIFDQTTTCYGIKNILPRYESPTQYLDEGITMSKGKIIDLLGLSLALKYFLEGSALNDKLLEELDTFTSHKLNSYPAEKFYGDYEVEKQKLTENYFQENHTSKTLSTIKNQKHLVQNGNINIIVTVNGVVEYGCSYTTDNTFSIGYVDPLNRLITLKELIEPHIKNIKKFSGFYKKLPGKKKNAIDKLLKNPNKIFSAAESAQLCAMINTSKIEDPAEKNRLLCLIYKSKFLGDYGPVVQSCVRDGTTPYLVHQTGDSSAQNQGIVLYLLSLYGHADAIYEGSEGVNEKADIGLRMCSDSGFINLDEEGQLISLNGIAMYLSTNDIGILNKSLTGSGKKVYKKVKSKKNKRKSSKKIKKTKKKTKSQMGGNIDEYGVSNVELLKLPENTILDYMNIIGDLEDHQIKALARDLYGTTGMNSGELQTRIVQDIIPRGKARSGSASDTPLGASNRSQAEQARLAEVEQAYLAKRPKRTESTAPS